MSPELTPEERAVLEMLRSNDPEAVMGLAALDDVSSARVLAHFRDDKVQPDEDPSDTPPPEEAAPDPEEAAPDPEEAAPDPEEAAPDPEEAAPDPRGGSTLRRICCFECWVITFRFPARAKQEDFRNCVWRARRCYVAWDLLASRPGCDPGAIKI